MINVTVHYDDDNVYTYTAQDTDTYYWQIGYKFPASSSIFFHYGIRKYTGFFEVIERSEDGKDVWVEWVEK